jgi:hypothetical protein
MEDTFATKKEKEKEKKPFHWRLISRITYTCMHGTYNPEEKPYTYIRTL